MVPKLDFPLTLAPTGMVPTKQQNPALPVSPAEIAETVRRCAEIGITAVHLHARNEQEEPAWEKKYYSEIIYQVRSKAPGVLINVSTSGRNWSELEKRADVLSLDGDLKPDIASLTTSSLNFLRGASINEPDTVRALAQIMQDRGITPELELFDLGMVNAANILAKQGVLKAPFLANIFLGSAFSAQANPLQLSAMLSALPHGTIWSGAGIGAFNLPSYALALASGGGVRVGLEDGLTLSTQGEKVLTSNEDLVERVTELAGSLDMYPMTGSQLSAKLSKSGAKKD